MKKITSVIFLFLFTNSLMAELNYNTNTDACYKNREIVYPLQEVFDALKQTLMQSNLNIVTVTKEDGILTAKGSTYNEDEETITSITMTIDFKERANGITSVKAIAAYSTQEKKRDTAQLGGGGISLPIPVPFTGKYTLVSSGNIDDSLWYQGFFSSLEKILFENYMKYSTVDEIKVEKIIDTKEKTQKVSKSESKSEQVTGTKQQTIPDTKVVTETEILKEKNSENITAKVVQETTTTPTPEIEK